LLRLILYFFGSNHGRAVEEIALQAGLVAAPIAHHLAMAVVTLSQC
jgi:hypothetical protein